MNALHKPLVALACTALNVEGGNVLDLGCGNGMLLARLCAERGGLIPYGIDINGFALEHARRLVPNFGANFIKGDFFDVGLWDGDARHYALTLFMLGRLLEVPKEKAIRFLTRLRKSCSRILVYTYPDWGDQPLDAIAAQFGLHLEESGCGTAAYLNPQGD
jgi:ubiquinone/menaquinone biosynthesis C-methylase UbiE